MQSTSPSFSGKGATIGGLIGGGVGLLAGGPAGALIGGGLGVAGGGFLPGILGGKKNPNPHIPFEIAGIPTPPDLYDFLVLLPYDKEKYFYLKDEDALPPYIFFPKDDYYHLIQAYKGKTSSYKSRGNFLSTDIVGQLGMLSGSKAAQFRFLNIIVFVILSIELYLDKNYNDIEVNNLIKNIQVDNTSGFLYEQLERKIAAALGAYFLSLTQEELSYLDIIASFTHNPYLDYLNPIVELL